MFQKVERLLAVRHIFQGHLEQRRAGSEVMDNVGPLILRAGYGRDAEKVAATIVRKM